MISWYKRASEYNLNWSDQEYLFEPCIAFDDGYQFTIVTLFKSKNGILIFR